MYRLVIFDLDNTLIDFSKYEEYAIKFMFKRLNIDIKSSDIPIKRFEIYFNKLKISNVNTTIANELFIGGTKLYQNSRPNTYKINGSNEPFFMFFYHYTYLALKNISSAFNISKKRLV